MIRLLQIEWLKLRHYRPFWILIGLYGLLTTVLAFSAPAFLRWLKNQGADFKGFDPTMIPLFDFPDIWQNMAFTISIFNILLAMIVIMSIYNEIQYRISRQNIIDGMSKWEWLQSKLAFIAAIAGSATILLFVTGLVIGFWHGHSDSHASIFRSMDFLSAYFLGIFTLLTFAMLLTLLIRKGGLLIVGLLMYYFMVEPFIAFFLYDYPKLSDTTRLIADFLPIQSTRNLIANPFPRYVFYEIQDYVSLGSFIIALGWALFNTGMSYWVLTRRDN